MYCTISFSIVCLSRALQLIALLIHWTWWQTQIIIRNKYLVYVPWNTLWKYFLFSFLCYHRSSVQLWFSPLMAQGTPDSKSNICLHFCLCRMSVIFSSMIIFSGTESSLLWFHTQFSCKNLCGSPASHLLAFWASLSFLPLSSCHWFCCFHQGTFLWVHIAGVSQLWYRKRYQIYQHLFQICTSW